MPSKKASSAGNQQERSKRSRLLLSIILIVVGGLLGYGVFDSVIDPLVIPITGYRNLLQVITIALFLLPGIYISRKEKYYGESL